MIPDQLILNRKKHTTTRNPERIHVPATGNEQMLTLKNILLIFIKRNKTLEFNIPHVLTPDLFSLPSPSDHYDEFHMSPGLVFTF